MKKYFLIPVLLIVASSMQAQELHAELTALRNAWKAAYESGDANALAVMYAQEVEFVEDDGSTESASRAQIEAEWQTFFATRSGTIEFGDDLVTTSLPDGRASMKGSFTQTRIDNETGERSTFEGVFDHQVKQVDGQWHLCHMKVTAR